MSTADHAARFAEHDAAIETLQRGQEEMRRGMVALAGKVDAGFERLTTAMHEIRGSAGPSFRDMMETGTRVVALVTALSLGIIYLARGGNYEELRKADEARHQLELRLTKLETVIALATIARRPTPGAAWVPEMTARGAIGYAAP